MSKDDNINTCINHLNDRIDNVIDEMRDISNLYVNACTEKSTLEEQIKSKKLPNGVPLTREKIEKMKRELYFVSQKVKKLKCEFDADVRMKNKLHKNLETLKKLCDVT